jgi:hypothetical protein
MKSTLTKAFMYGSTMLIVACSDISTPEAPANCDEDKFDALIIGIDDQLGITGALNHYPTNYSKDTTIICLEDKTTIITVCDGQGQIRTQMNPLSCDAFLKLKK